MSNGLKIFTSDPGIPVLVEGERDEELIRQLVREFEGEYVIRERGGDSKVLEALDILVDIELPRIGVILDLDNNSPNDIYEKCYNKLEGNHSNVSKLNNNKISIKNRSIVQVGYSGLPNDPDISELSIERHAIEDHVLKLLLDDDQTVQRISESGINDSDSLKDALINIENELEEHHGTIVRGKVHLEIAKITLGYESHTNSFIHNLLQCTNIDYQNHPSTQQILSFFDSLEEL
ncbi:DUF3226 domain-containing protein [Halorussus marinus]|uniref:DUF3226 domain-containing protein n=1 Tax=Halorussus marinus TaxID=2505976 RepID=UPI00106E742B|nr:DUF3226 domain-containing protein [Halorussus marinus]